VQGGALKEAEFDLVVLAVGVQPNLDTKSLFGDNDLQHDATSTWRRSTRT